MTEVNQGSQEAAEEEECAEVTCEQGRSLECRVPSSVPGPSAGAAAPAPGLGEM